MITRYTQQAIFIVGFLFVASACHLRSNETKESFKRIDTTTVEVNDQTRIKIERIEEKPYPISVELPGKVSIPDGSIVNLSARAAGRVESVKVTIGDSVKSGQPVADLWSPDLITAAEEYAMALNEKDKSLIDLSQQKLRAMGIDPADAKTGAKTYPLRSPIAGVVLDRKVNGGSTVQIGDLILIIGKLGNYQFQGEVTPTNANQIKAGMKVVFDEQPNLRATVVNVNPIADPNSNLVKVRANFDSQQTLNVPQETFLKARVVTTEKPALVISSKALLVEEKGSYVFMRETPNRFKKVPVKVLNRTGGLMSIEESAALKAGVEVVTDGSILLTGILEGED